MVVTKKPTPYSHLMVFIGIASVLGRRSTLKMKSILKLDSHFHRLIMPFHLFNFHEPLPLASLVTALLPRSLMLLMPVLKPRSLIEVTRRDYSLIMGCKLNSVVLDFKCQETARKFMIMLRSWRISLRIIGLQFHGL